MAPCSEKFKKAVRKVNCVGTLVHTADHEEDSSNNIKVCVRVRPFIKEELEGNRSGGKTELCIAMPTTKVVVMDNKREEKKTFEFDRCYWSHSEDHPLVASQQTLMDELGMDMLNNAMKGFNNCMFAYGQTGSGKSFSVLGGRGDARGLLPRVVEGLFEHFRTVGEGVTCKTAVAFIEIYNETIHDLLAPKGCTKKLDAKQHPVLGMHIPGLTEAAVGTCAEVLQLVDYGTTMRHVSATAMNATSSRSHCIFTFKTAMSEGGNVANMSQTHLVDLAGSERAGRTKADAARLKEGAAINKSLTNLARVISALAAQSKKGPKQNPPYRDSKLTYILKDSLSGNSKTVMMAAISPNVIDYDETVTTMNFAKSVKLVQTKATCNTVNEKSIEAQLRQELEELRATLQRYEAGEGGGAAHTEHVRRCSKITRRIEEQEELCKWFGKDWDSLLAEERSRMRRRGGRGLTEDDISTLHEQLDTQRAEDSGSDTTTSEADLSGVDGPEHCALVHIAGQDLAGAGDGHARASVSVPPPSCVAVVGPASRGMVDGDARELTKDCQELKAVAVAAERASAELSPAGTAPVKLLVGMFVDIDTGQPTAEPLIRATRNGMATEWLSADDLIQRGHWLQEQSYQAAVQGRAVPMDTDAWVTSATAVVPRQASTPMRSTHHTAGAERHLGDSLHAVGPAGGASPLITSLGDVSGTQRKAQEVSEQMDKSLAVFAQVEAALERANFTWRRSLKIAAQAAQGAGTPAEDSLGEDD